MSSPTDIVLAVDGGASRTRAWIVRLDGSVVARGAAGGANVFDLGVDVARRVIAEATLAAWHGGAFPGEKPCAFLAVFAGVAGAGASEDQQALATALAAEFGVSPANTRVDHDLRIALAGALAEQPGVVILAGTGSAAFGRNAAGQSARVGGWGPVLDDGGSGHWLGVQAMRLVVRVADGRSAPTPLAAQVVAQLGASSPRDMLHRLQPAHSARLQRAEIAALAPLVIAAAAEGDQTAKEILVRGADELAAMAATAWRRLSPGATGALRLAAAGGLLEHHELYFDRVAEAVRRELGPVALEHLRLPPVGGAALLALEVAGCPLTPEIIARVGASAAAPEA